MFERRTKYFGDILSAERLKTPRQIKKKDPVDYELIDEVLWEAFNGRGKRASKPVTADETADKYYTEEENDYITGDCQWL
jgi:hypothetical protein